MTTSRQSEPSAKPPARTRDPIATRTRIVAAAEREFSTFGFAGTKLEAVARRAGVTKGLLFHYFPSKQALYVTVMERIYATLRSRQDEAVLGGLGPEEGVRRLAEDTFQSFLDHPEVVSMMNEENLHKARNIEGSAAIPELYNPLIAEIRRLLAEGIEAKVFRTDADPVAFYIALSGLGYFYCSNQHTLSTVFKVDLLDRHRVAAYKNLIADMAVSYLRSGK